MSRICRNALLLLVTISTLLTGQSFAQENQSYSCADITQISQQECNGLQRLYDVGIHAVTWFTSDNPCDWANIVCEEGQLIQLDLVFTTDVTEIPDAIGAFPDLLYLNIVDNVDLVTISAEIGQLTNLQGLSILGNSQLSSLPESIRTLSNLTTLNIGNNKSLFEIPDSITEESFPNIETYYIRLVMRCTDMIGISLQECEGLQGLYDVGVEPLAWFTTENPCDWKGILCEDGKIIQLEIVFATRITEIPDAIGMFPDLLYLNIVENINLVMISEEIGKLTTLQGLSIWGNSQLASLPESIGTLPNLTTLYITDNSSLTIIPDRISEESFPMIETYDVQDPVPNLSDPTAVSLSQPVATYGIDVIQILFLVTMLGAITFFVCFKYGKISVRD